MRVWKVIGLAGVAGVAAGSVAVAREQRKRNSYTPDEIRSKLRERVDGSSGSAPETPASS
jgi:hypothetical protein